MLMFLLLLRIFAHLESNQAAKEIVCGNLKEAFPVPLPASQNVEYACPAQSKEIDQLKKLSTQLNELLFCLFKKNFTQTHESEKLCWAEVKPLLIQIQGKNNQPMACGDKGNRFIYSFGYFYCGGKVNLKEILQKENLQYIPMYQICYDTVENTTIWTSHQLMKPSLFRSPSFKEKYYCANEISTEAYSLDSEHFLKMKQKYEVTHKKYSHLAFEKNHTKYNFIPIHAPISIQKYSSKGIPVIPQPMVPAQHFATLAWQKTTNHYINTSPLWSQLVPLMTVIDNAIKKAAINVNFATFTSGEQWLIFTRTKPYFWSKVQSSVTTFSEKKFFKRNIWYKFVYSSARKSGVMIYIHNTPNKPIRMKKSRAWCDFKEWTKDVEVQKIISTTGLQYAYCTRPTAGEVKKIFHINVKIQAFLDIYTYL